jgi:hypothetical protein
MNFHTSGCLLALLLLSACNAQRPQIPPINPRPSDDDVLKIKGISEREAVAIAERDATRIYGPLGAFKVIACEQVIFWRIIFDNGGPEYVIDKSSGSLLSVQKIPQSGDRVGKLVPQENPITRQEAIAIARQEALKVYKDPSALNDFVVLACEQSEVWRVLFDYRLRPGEDLKSLPNARFPSYVIDKTTGAVLYRDLN